MLLGSALIAGCDRGTRITTPALVLSHVARDGTTWELTASDDDVRFGRGRPRCGVGVGSPTADNPVRWIGGTWEDGYSFVIGAVRPGVAGVRVREGSHEEYPAVARRSADDNGYFIYEVQASRGTPREVELEIEPTQPPS